MRPISANELLAAWEQGLAQAPVQQALTLLAAASDEGQLEALAKLSVGERDARLLTLREWAFGSQLNSLVACPGCSEQLEFSFDANDIRVTAASSASGPEGDLSVSVGDYQVSFRLPNSFDLYAILDSQDVAESRRRLLQRCLLTAHHRGKKKSAKQLPAPVVDAMARRMAQVDPQATVELALSCPECSHRWRATFDIVSFFWSEINAWASRILREVHTLACAYGWREADILAMSPWRRQCYLDMVGG